VKMGLKKVALIYLGRRGGGATYSLEIAKALAGKAVVMSVVSMQAFNYIDWQRAGISLLPVSTYENKWEFVSSTLDIMKHYALHQAIKRFDPDVIYYPMVHFWTPLLNFGLPSTPKVVTIHDPILHQGERGALLQFLQQTVIRQATRVVILSQTFVDAIVKHGVPQERVDVIPHGEFSHYAPNVRLPAAREVHHPPTLLFFGRIVKYKGLEVLLEAYPLMKKQIPNLRLMIVGEGDLSSYIPLLASLSDVTVVNRWIADSEVATYFLQANVLVAPYVDASQSGVIPIACALKVPVVATRVGGIPEQVDDGKTGLLVPPGDPFSLAEACVRLLIDEPYAASMGIAGYEKAIREWSWASIADQIVLSIDRACNTGCR